MYGKGLLCSLHLKPEIEQLVLQMASENAIWGYDRIAGAVQGVNRTYICLQMIRYTVFQ